MTMFRPGQVWRDSAGAPIQAHGGGMLLHEGVYYWHGEDKSAPNRPGAHQVDAIGVRCYSSRDLLLWHDEGLALPTVPGDANHDLHPRNVLERPKVLFNAPSGKFVMWAHVDSPDYSKAAVGVAVSDSPVGPFVYRGSFRPCGAESRDMTLFQDSDGAAYLVHSSENNATLHIAPLTDDFLDVRGDFARVFVGESREAPALWQHGGRYFMVTSFCTGWNPNQALWHSASSVMGEWKTGGDPCVAGPHDDADALLTFRAQSSFVLPLPNERDRFIFGADRWNPGDLEDSRYVWLPLQMREGAPAIEWRDEW